MLGACWLLVSQGEHPRLQQLNVKEWKGRHGMDLDESTLMVIKVRRTDSVFMTKEGGMVVTVTCRSR